MILSTGLPMTASVPADLSYAAKPPKPVAGILCLDFVNTVTWRGDPSRRAERLSSYNELLLWSEMLATISARTGAQLRKAAAADPKAAAAVLARALKLRHEIEHLFDPALAKMKANPVLDALMLEMARIGRLLPEKGWQRRGDRIDLSLPLLPVAVSALSLLTAPQRAHARNCADPLCSWVFLDESRNQSRQWCSMEDCGNRAKARAHYARVRGAR